VTPEWYREFIEPGILLLIAACIMGIVYELLLGDAVLKKREK